MDNLIKDPKPMKVYCSDGVIEFTPRTEVARAFAEMRNASYHQGLKACTDEEVDIAFALERAGYDGLSRIWVKEGESREIP